MKRTAPLKKNLIWAAILTTSVGVAVLSCADTTSPPPPSGDTTPPTLTITRSPSADTVDVNLPIQVTVTASDDLALASLNVTISGGATSTFDTTFTSVLQTFSTTLAIEVAGSSGGLVVIVATATDGAGNEGTSSDSLFVIDQVAPLQTVENLTPSLSVAAGGTLAVGVRFQDPSGTALGVVNLFGTDGLGNPIILVADSVDHSATTIIDVTDTLTLAIPATLTPGVYTIGTFATDNAGNSGAGDSIRTINVVDNTDPSGAFLNPPVDSTVFVGDSVLVRLRAQDLSGVASVLFQGFGIRGVDSLGTTDTVQRYADVTADLVGSRDSTIVRFMVAIAAEQTVERITFKATIFDLAGNSSIAATTIQLAPGGGGGGGPTQGPTITFQTPPADSQVNVGDSVLVTIRVQDSTGIGSVRLTGISARGDSALGTDTLVTRLAQRDILFGVTVIDTTIMRYLRPSSDDTQAEFVTLFVDATNRSGDSTTNSRRIELVRGRFVNIILPNSNTHAVGTPLPITIAARSPDSIVSVRWTVTGVVTADSVNTFVSPLADSVLIQDSLVLASNANLGTITITPSAIDAVGNSFAGTPVTLTLTDELAPTITFVAPAPGALVRIGDTLRVSVRVQDNKGVASLTLEGVAHRGDPTLGTDSVVSKLVSKTVALGQNPDTTVVRDLVPTDPEDTTSETVYVRVTAVDSSGNTTLDSIAVSFVSGPSLSVTLPLDGSVVSPGKAISISIRGQAVTGVSKIGYITAGVWISDDTTTVIPVANPQTKDTTIVFIDTIPGTTALGTFTITPFGRDSLGNVGTGPPITIVVVANAGAGDTLAPLITDLVDLRVERTDSIAVRGQDPGGITKLGFVVTTFDAPFDTLAADSVIFSGIGTDIGATFALQLDTLTIGVTAQLVRITAFGEDSLGNRGFLSRTGLPNAASAAQDTVTVVEGRTLRLPAGGRIADALYNPNLNEIYLSNVDRDRIEVFDVGTLAFGSAIVVGSRPWGIDMYPADTLGNTLDTLVIANSGGTSFSMVDLAARRESRRHQVPIFVVQKISISIENGFARVDIVNNHFSDRPQNVGVVCRVTTGTTNCAQDSIMAVFSTSPSIDQGENKLRGTLRWENISTGQDLLAGELRDAHLFYEHSQGSAGLTLDTLQILAGYPDTVVAILGAARGVMANIATIPFLDTTFVRSTGNHARVMIGEGGTGDPIAGFARAMRFKTNSGFTKVTGPPVLIANVLFSDNFQTDGGVSAAINVSDFISNTAIPISAIATNFNGLTNAVRADSVYLLDENLRLAGIVSALGDNPGLDMPFNHAFDATPDGAFPPASFPANRIIYTARDDSNIDVFDTQYYGSVAQIPIKDPVTGPITIAQLPGGAQFLIAVTDNGVVVITLPAINNPFPAGGF